MEQAALGTQASRTHTRRLTAVISAKMQGLGLEKAERKKTQTSVSCSQSRKHSVEVEEGEGDGSVPSRDSLDPIISRGSSWNTAPISGLPSTSRVSPGWIGAGPEDRTG